MENSDPRIRAGSSRIMLSTKQKLSPVSLNASQMVFIYLLTNLSFSFSFLVINTGWGLLCCCVKRSVPVDEDCCWRLSFWVECAGDCRVCLWLTGVGPFFSQDVGFGGFLCHLDSTAISVRWMHLTLFILGRAAGVYLVRLLVGFGL
jgi:hypothetical protein